MSHISRAELERLTGYKRRTIQRLAGEGAFPGAVRTSAGHWQIPDSPEVRKRCEELARKLVKKRAGGDARETQQYFRQAAYFAEYYKPEFAERLSVELRLGRQIRAMRKTLQDLSQWDETLRDDLPTRLDRLVLDIRFYSNHWKRADGAV